MNKLAITYRNQRKFCELEKLELEVMSMKTRKGRN